MLSSRVYSCPNCTALLFRKNSSKNLLTGFELPLIMPFCNRGVSVIIIFCYLCRRLPNFGRSPEFGSFQKIAQNFCAIFKIGLKRPKKLPNTTKNVDKTPGNSTEFLHIRQQKHPKKSPEKLPFFLIANKTFCFSQSTHKASKFW